MSASARAKFIAFFDTECFWVGLPLKKSLDIPKKKQYLVKRTAKLTIVLFTRYCFFGYINIYETLPNGLEIFLRIWWREPNSMVGLKLQQIIPILLYKSTIKFGWLFIPNPRLRGVQTVILAQWLLQRAAQVCISIWNEKFLAKPSETWLTLKPLLPY